MADYFLPLKDRKEVAAGTMAFWFDTSGTDFSFEAGQHADFVLLDPPETDAEGNKRVFSIASSSHHQDYIMIATRMRPTAFKNSLKSVPLGTKVKATQAAGNMTLHEEASKPAVFLAGGIGITPFRSMIECATHEHLPQTLVLFYTNRTPKATAFLNDLESWAGMNQNLKLVLTITDADDASWTYEKGRIDEALVKKHVDNLTKPVYYSAGPPAMVLAMRKMLLGLGVSKDNIKLESFSGY